MSAEIHYQRLNADNFTGYSLDDFVRHQSVTESWRKKAGDWKLVPNVYEENWSQLQCREIAEDVVHHINFGQTGFGAFDGERIIGFATVSHRIFGTAARYVQLVCFQISKGSAAASSALTSSARVQPSARYAACDSFEE